MPSSKTEVNIPRDDTRSSQTPRLPSGFLPYADWTPFSQVTTRRSVDLLRERNLVESAKATDDPKGRNNYWAATTELGAAWRNSRLKWRWRSRLPEANRLLSNLKDESEVEDDVEEKKKLLEMLKRPLPRSEEISVQPPSRSLAANAVTVSAARHRVRDRDKENDGGAALIGHTRQPSRSGLETWVVDEEVVSVAQEKETGITKSNNQKSSSNNPSQLQPVQQAQGRPEPAIPPSRTEPPPCKKPKFGIFSSSSKPVSVCDGQDPTSISSARPPRKPTTFGHPANSSAAPAASRPVKFGLCGLSSVPQQNDRPGSQEKPPDSVFRTANDKLMQDYIKKYGVSRARTLGASRPASTGFRPPLANGSSDEGYSSYATAAPTPTGTEEPVDERLKSVDPKMVELIRQEIMDSGATLHWDDIAGLQFVKGVIKEIVVFPMLRPDIFKGLKAPPKGLLLFGPPGTGKTLIGRSRRAWK